MKILLFLLAALACLPAHAASSPWFETDGAKMRLLARPVVGGLEAALQVELEPGFKTYWKVPGASGVPPMITLGGDAFSDSIASVQTKIRWPAPQVYRDGSGLVTGYTNAVTFPIDITGSVDALPQLVARGLIGVCGEICIPVQFSLTVPLNRQAGSSVEEARVFAAAHASTTPSKTVSLQARGKFLTASATSAAGQIYWVSSTEGTAPILGTISGSSVTFDVLAKAGETGLLISDGKAARAEVIPATD
ncbi:MAG: protein-disulfide reductase DsbD domain-containing protein [Pseudomonadota bacterium]